MTDAKTLVDISAKGAEAFVEIFYRTFDTQRSLIGRFYRPHSQIVWNGNPHGGADIFAAFANSLPSSSHEVLAFDCQPLESFLSPTGTPSILVNVNGTVKYGSEISPRVFTQTFVLTPDITKQDSANFYVSSDVFRIVS